jgi:U3 small nucleolar ribonucleoprotein protein IMP4
MQVLVTTSRDPSSSLTTFAKEVALLIPGAKKQNRGATILSELVEGCRASSVTDIIILHEHRCAALINCSAACALKQLSHQVL